MRDPSRSASSTEARSQPPPQGGVKLPCLFGHAWSDKMKDPSHPRSPAVVASMRCGRHRRLGVVVVVVLLLSTLVLWMWWWSSPSCCAWPRKPCDPKHPRSSAEDNSKLPRPPQCRTTPTTRQDQLKPGAGAAANNSNATQQQEPRNRISDTSSRQGCHHTQRLEIANEHT